MAHRTITANTLETGKGDFALGIALGIVLRHIFRLNIHSPSSRRVGNS